MRSLRHRSRRFTAGVALALAATSGTLILTASPSFAVGLTPVPATGPAAGTGKVVVTIASGTFASGVAVEFPTPVPCPAAYTTPATTSVVAATVTAFTGTPTAITVTVPTLTTA